MFDNLLTSLVGKLDYEFIIKARSGGYYGDLSQFMDLIALQANEWMWRGLISLDCYQATKEKISAARNCLRNLRTIPG